MLRTPFENEGKEFRDYMAAHPNAVVVRRGLGADGQGCEVEDQPQTIDGELIPDAGDQ